MKKALQNIFGNRWAGAALIAASAVAATAWSSLSACKWYRSESVLATPQQSADTHRRRWLPGGIDAQREILLSEPVLMLAILAYDSPAASSAPAEPVKQILPERLDEMRRRISVTPSGEGANLFVLSIDWPQEPGDATRLGVDSRQLAAQRAQRIARALVGAYLDYVGQKEQQAVAPAAASQQASAGLLRQQRDESRQRLEQYVEGSVSGEFAQVVRAAAVGQVEQPSSVEALLAELDQAQAKLAELSATRDAIGTQLAKPPAEMAVPTALLTSRPGMGEIAYRVSSLRLTLSTLLPHYGRDSQDIVKVRKELDAAYGEMRHELTAHQQGLEQEIAALTARRDALAAAVEQSRQRSADLSVKAARYKLLSDDAQQAAGAFQEAQRQLGTLETLRSADAPAVSVLNGPTLPTAPARPLVTRNVLIALPVGVAVGLVYALAWGRLVRRIPRRPVNPVER